MKDREIYIPGAIPVGDEFTDWLMNEKGLDEPTAKEITQRARSRTPKKPDNNYVLAALRIIEADPTQPVTLKARGIATSRAIEIAHRLKDNYRTKITRVHISQEKTGRRRTPQIEIIIEKNKK